MDESIKVPNQSSDKAQTPIQKVTEILQTKSELPVEVRGFPKVTDSEFRLACQDIADALANHWKFKSQVIGAMILLLFGLAVAGFGLLGLTIKDTANDQIKQARNDVNNQIQDQFKTENITRVVEQVASKNASALIYKFVKPAVGMSQKTLDDFNHHLKDQQMAADKELELFRVELEKLQKRNAMTELADDAIENGNLDAFHKLRDLTSQNLPPEGATSELLRVFESYSIFSPHRWVGLELDPKVIDPTRNKQEEISPEKLLEVIDKSTSAPVRGIASDLLAKNGKMGSYSTAKALMSDLQKENNLEVIRRMKSALFHIDASFVDGGTVDAQDAFDWWKAHEVEVKKADTDIKK